MENIDATDIVEMLLHGNQLKRTSRTGWVQRGVSQGETVAAHSYGVAFAALILAQLTEEAVDLGKALALAVLHDLPEGLTGDFPAPAKRFLPPGVKPQMERAALDEILGDTPFEPRFLEWWEELQADDSPEARLVHDADKIDLYVQALVFEEQTGNKHLAEFWQASPSLHLPEARTIYEALRRRRDRLHGG
ncbi:MAG: HD domain-containing protein [bacterium]